MRCIHKLLLIRTDQGGLYNSVGISAEVLDSKLQIRGHSSSELTFIILFILFYFIVLFTDWVLCLGRMSGWTEESRFPVFVAAGG